MAILGHIHSTVGPLLKSARQVRSMGSRFQELAEALRLFSSMHDVLNCFHLGTQVARDGLAALHGDPKRAALGEEKFELAEGQAAADKQASNKESWQKTVLDSLVGQDSS